MTTPTPESVKALADLADRVEAAQGPDRELDCAIAIALSFPPSASARYGREAVWTCENGYRWHCPTYTASLDAAMLLVPEGHTVQLSDWDHAVLREKGPWQAIVLPLGARGAMQQFTFTNRCDHAAAAALALTAAALRARAHIGASHD